MGGVAKPPEHRVRAASPRNCLRLLPGKAPTRRSSGILAPCPASATVPKYAVKFANDPPIVPVSTCSSDASLLLTRPSEFGPLRATKMAFGESKICGHGKYRRDQRTT